MLNAMLHVLEHGERASPQFRQLAKHLQLEQKGVLERIFARLQQEQMIRINADAFSLDSTVIKVHPDGTGALKKNGPQSVGRFCGGWTIKLHLIAASAECALIFSLSPGQAGDAPEGRRLLTELGAASEPSAMIMDRAYEGDETRAC